MFLQLEAAEVEVDITGAAQGQGRLNSLTL